MERVKDQRYLYRRGGFLYFRRSVPKDVRAAFGGRREVWVALETADLREARHLMTKQLAEFDNCLSTARGTKSPVAVQKPLRVPLRIEIEEAVREVLAERLVREHTDYSSPDAGAAGVDLVGALSLQEKTIADSLKLGSRAGPSLSTEWMAEALIDRFRWDLPKAHPEYRFLLRFVAQSQKEAIQQLKADIEGEPRIIGDARFAPEQYQLDAERRRGRETDEPVSLMGLFDDYADERKPAPATVKAYRRQVAAFVSFIGHDDAKKIRFVDVVSWKQHLLTVPNAKGNVRTAKTVGETYLSALKTALKWGVENAKLKSNPAEQVRVRAPRPLKLRSKSLSDSEALTILRATLTAPPARLSPERAFARRWVPWLCAYTGRRVDEMSQLRAEDIQKHEGVWAVRVTPEAGGQKNNEARIVALHPHLIEQGFVSEVSKRKGSLFYDPSRHRGGGDGHRQSKKVGQHLAEWVRDLGIVGVAPNHGWRHRFKTLAKRHRLDPTIADYIQGHAPRTEGEYYGDIEPLVTLAEIKRLPAYKL